MPWFCDCLPGCCPGWSVDGNGTPRHGDPFGAARYVPPVITPLVVPDPVPREPDDIPIADWMATRSPFRRDDRALRGCLALAAIGFAFQRIADWICVVHHVSQTDSYRVANPIATSLMALGLEGES